MGDLDDARDDRVMRRIFERAIDAILLTDQGEKIVDANPAASELLGMSRDELRGRSLADLAARPEELEQVRAKLRSEGRAQGELGLKRADGATQCTEYTAVAEIAPGIDLTILRGITEPSSIRASLREAEGALRASEARFRAMIEKSEDGVTLLGPDVRTIYQSPAVERLFGYTQEEARSIAWNDFVAPQDLPLLQGALAQLMERPGANVSVVFRMRHRDGRIRLVELSATNLLHDPDVGAVVANFRDISERMSLEREKEGFFSLSIDLLCIAGEDGRFRRLNPAWERTLGWSLNELMARPLLDFVHPDDREATALKRLQQTQGEETLRFENRYRCKDGTYRWLQWAAKAQVEDGVVYATARDVTQSRADAERNRLMFDASPVAMSLIEAETLRFLDVNEAATAMYGYTREELLQMSLEEIVVPGQHADMHAKARTTLTESHVRITDRRHRTKSGAVLDVEVTGHRLTLGDRAALLMVAIDVTEPRRLQAQLVQAQKMEAVGRLAGGIAHDFNNLLTVVLGCASFARDSLAPDHPARAEVEQIAEAGERGSALTKQLLAFSRQQVVQPSSLDLNRCITDLKKLLGRLLGERVELVLAVDAPVGRVFADPGQIEQVVMNLAINARDAMPGGGQLALATADVLVDASSADRHEGIPPGEYVVLEVRDSGTGMDAATVERIFEPFFTTKPRDQGTGLGLSTVYGIVKQCEGHIRVESAPGAGTTFEVYFPRSLRAGDVAGSSPSSSSSHFAAPGRETILLAEDDPAVRATLCAILRRRDYRVLEAASGNDALSAAGEHGSPIDLLVTDVIMPQMSGRELAQRLRQGRPDMAVLYVSGYPDEELAPHGVLAEGVAYLPKPVTPDALAAKVRRLLDARKG